MTAAMVVGVAVLAGSVVGVVARFTHAGWVGRASGPARVHGRGSQWSTAVGLGAGLLAVGTVLHFGLTWLLPAHLLMVVAAVVLSAVDLQFRRLPDVVVLPATVGLLVLLVVGSAGTSEWSALARAVCAGLILFAVFLLMALVSPAGIGMGDVKLALAVGAYTGFFGWNVLALGTLLSFVAAAAVGAVLLLSRRVQPGAAVPFGPSMFLGALVAVWLA